MENHGGNKRSCKERATELVQIGAPAAPAYWKSPEELHKGLRATGEFPGGLPPVKGGQSEATRRDFLAMMGFSLAAGLVGCRAPVQNAIPLLVGSDQIIPGVSNYYATTCRGCASSCSLVVKQRDGRPIKIEGNAESALFGNGTCATGQATVLSLYDDARLRQPVWHGQPAKWDEVDQEVREAVHAAQSNKSRIVLLSGTITSPSMQQIIADWKAKYPNFSHVTYDPISLSAIRAANVSSFGRAVVPHYLFDKAQGIVALEADFLGTWLSPVEFARAYAARRKPEATPALHIQFESGFSVTGSNADVRVPVAPSEMGAVALALLRRVAGKAHMAGVHDGADPIPGEKLDAIADELWKHRGESLVISGVNEVSVQKTINALNGLLGNIGKTVDLAHPSLQRSGDDQAMAELVEAMDRGDIHTLILYGVNPAYDYADAGRFLSALQNVKLSVSFADRLDETSLHVHAVCPDHHFLEAWGDAEPVESHFSLGQPLIAPLFETRAAAESLLRWLDDPQTNYYTYLREFWRKRIFSRQAETQNFDVFWDRCLQDGVAVLPSLGVTHSPSLPGHWEETVNTILQANRPANAAHSDDSYELHFYESVALRDGRHANNPWLQELPDPISKLTWGNCAGISATLAQKIGLQDGDVVRLKTDKGQIEIPAFVQPGQQAHTISVALGHGRTASGKAGDHVGVNVFPLASIKDGFRSYCLSNVLLEKTGRRESLAGTQSHFSFDGRPIVLETTLAELKAGEHNEIKESLPTLWAERLQGEHSWGMAIDMNACTGCSACIVACQAENNVPVVGKDQVERIRIMHWIRIDRYYSGPEENPVSLHQPMMCQHCQNAPCETVCPVLATTTSSEGLNQQVYNRCIGTRYCANNCPYKVRRFNWYNYTENPQFDFNMANPLGRMVLNPDVAVRSRGVMEKCTMCVQRIQLAKNIALQENRPVAEGDIQTACQQACPTQAIVFGDLKDPDSHVSRLRRSQRHYEVLEDLGVRPNVGYLKKVRNAIGTT